MYLLAAITLGFLGSFHCIGMCGPIALSLPIHTQKISLKVYSILVYNFGRVITYTFFGAISGFIGQSFALFGLQQALSISLGLAILVALLTPQSYMAKNKLSVAFYRLFYSLKDVVSKQFKKNGLQSLFTIGILNGLLPCGLVYIAIASSISTGNIVKGMIFMALFGIGTIPFMFSITFYSNLISIQVRNGIRKSMPLIIGAMALLLIIRGMNLGIPYISPKVISENKQTEEVPVKTIKCCHK